MQLTHRSTDQGPSQPAPLAGARTAETALEAEVLIKEARRRQRRRRLAIGAAVAVVVGGAVAAGVIILVTGPAEPGLSNFEAARSLLPGQTSLTRSVLVSPAGAQGELS
jgi:hypothetical protein